MNHGSSLDIYEEMGLTFAHLGWFCLINDSVVWRAATCEWDDLLRCSLNSSCDEYFFFSSFEIAMIIKQLSPLSWPTK